CPCRTLTCRSFDTISSGFSRFPAIADPPICGTNLSQLVDHFQGATPGLRHVLLIDHDPNRPGLVDLTGPETIGPCVEYIPGYGSNTRAFSQTTAILDQVDNNQQPDPEQYDVQFCNWDAATPDYRVDGISQLIKDGTTLEAYEDQKTGSSGKTHYDFHNRMRASEAPWEERREISDWFRGRMGNNVTRRTTPKTMQFKPNAWKYTPGFMACIELDWSADGLEGLPGDVEGDSVDTYGAPYMNWNLDPKFDYEGLTLRRILMEVTQGALIASDPVTVIGDSRVNSSMGTIFGIGGYRGTDKLAVDCYDGMFMNTGDVQGNVDITARANSDVAVVMDDGDFTLSSGNSLTIYGMSNVGFDGVSATTRTLTIEPGSTVSFKPTLRIWCQENGASYFLPKPGHEMTGSGGTIGTVREFQPRIEDDFMVILDDIQYVPANAEDVSGVVIRGLDDDQGEKTDYARLDYNEHAPEVWFDGSISEVVTGIKEFDDFKTDKVIEPNMPSAVVINGWNFAPRCHGGWERDLYARQRRLRVRCVRCRDCRRERRQEANNRDHRERCCSPRRRRRWHRFWRDIMRSAETRSTPPAESGVFTIRTANRV
ncbi:MAG: hypothetical protein ACU0FH_24430, partial [Heliomarina sp.]|uniref:hypothetical protein n=1 Tax=Heliomarina sp. TaxID=2917556 RepID=UPI004058F201